MFPTQASPQRLQVPRIRKAQENGAIIIHVDPRFSRTSAAADIYARIRPGAGDMGVLNNYLPGYLDYPTDADSTLTGIYVHFLNSHG